MSEVLVCTEGRAGRITLNRPAALNALNRPMVSAIDAALDAWAGDDAVALVLIDAAGDKAFCAGGDIGDLYRAGKAGDYGFARDFWRFEYPLNAKIAEYAKPVVSLMQGFTMGGGVGIGCHCRHRIVGDSSRIAMPECGIGLVPDVGGSLLLARAPGRMGEYLGLTAARMGPGEAIRAGFADLYAPEADWPAIAAALCETGDIAALPAAPPPPSALPEDAIDRLFAAGSLDAIAAALAAEDSDFARDTLKALGRNSPLSMATTLALISTVRETPTIRRALSLEYRATWRCIEQGDFLEGIRAAIIDKDRTPRWRHAPGEVTKAEMQAMLAPLGEHELVWEDRT